MRASRSAFVFVVSIAAALGGCARPVKPAKVEPPSAPALTATFSLTAFDVGTGLAVLVRGEDFSLLYDGGSNDDRKLGHKNRLLAYLGLTLGPSSEPRCRHDEQAPASSPPAILDHVFVSHPHRDHLELLPDVFRCYSVANVWESGQEADTGGFRALRAAIEREPTIRHRLGGRDFEAGTTFTLGREASAVVLSVRPDARDPNDASIVVRLDLGSTRVLLMGDATGGERRDPSSAADRGSTEATLLARSRAELAADVLVVGHHGSTTSTRATFLDAVRPRIAIISSGPTKYHGVVLPDPAILELLRSRRVETFRTDDDDAACRASSAKIGLDDDGAPGGCSAVTLAFEPSRPPTRAPSPVSD